MPFGKPEKRTVRLHGGKSPSRYASLRRSPVGGLPRYRIPPGIQPGTRLTSVRFAMRIRDGRPFRLLRLLLGRVESTVSAPAFGNPRAGRSAPGDQWASNVAARCFFSFTFREPIECQEWNGASRMEKRGNGSFGQGTERERGGFVSCGVRLQPAVCFVSALLRPVLPGPPASVVPCRGDLRSPAASFGPARTGHASRRRKPY